MVIAVVVSVAVLTAVVVMISSFARDGDELGLDAVPAGVSTGRVAAQPIFLVRRGRHVRAFLAQTRHLQNEPLWWCPAEEVLLGPDHGAMFLSNGRLFAGPARGGLSEYPVLVKGAVAVVDTDRVIEGPARGSRRPTGSSALLSQSPGESTVGSVPTRSLQRASCRTPGST